MSDRTPARPTGATEKQIEAAVRRGIPETMDWEYSAGCTVLISIRDAAALLIPPGYSIVPDTLLEAVEAVVDDHHDAGEFSGVPLGKMQDLRDRWDAYEQERS